MLVFSTISAPHTLHCVDKTHPLCIYWGSKLHDTPRILVPNISKWCARHLDAPLQAPVAPGGVGEGEGGAELQEEEEYMQWCVSHFPSVATGD